MSAIQTVVLSRVNDLLNNLVSRYGPEKPCEPFLAIMCLIHGFIYAGFPLAIIYNLVQLESVKTVLINLTTSAIGMPFGALNWKKQLTDADIRGNIRFSLLTEDIPNIIYNAKKKDLDTFIKERFIPFIKKADTNYKLTAKANTAKEQIIQYLGIISNWRKLRANVNSIWHICPDNTAPTQEVKLVKDMEDDLQKEIFFDTKEEFSEEYFTPELEPETSRSSMERSSRTRSSRTTPSRGGKRRKTVRKHKKKTARKYRRLSRKT
jgi:hypothetical protein